jgi:hypothetical protein
MSAVGELKAGDALLPSVLTTNSIEITGVHPRALL